MSNELVEIFNRAVNCDIYEHHLHFHGLGTVITLVIIHVCFDARRCSTLAPITALFHDTIVIDRENMSSKNRRPTRTTRRARDLWVRHPPTCCRRM